MLARLRDPEIRAKYIEHLEAAHKLSVSKYGGIVPTREEISAALDDRIAKAESFTRVDFGEDMPNRGDGLHLNWKDHHQGRELTEQDWATIEAHEKGHEVRMDGLPFRPNAPRTPDQIDYEYFDTLFLDAVDPSVIPFPWSKEEYQKFLDAGETTLTWEEQKAHAEAYNRSGGEILERMSQLKNYFGMRKNEEFTKAHLDYAREHYAADRFDNMSEFFQMITPEKEERFLELMNSVGV